MLSTKRSPKGGSTSGTATWRSLHAGTRSFGDTSAFLRVCRANGLLPWDGIAEVSEALALRSGELLVDLACGRGGYGLELAARSGARLLGIDFSAEAIRQARDLAAEWDVEAEFRIGDLVATDLSDASADAVVVVDAIQFASDPSAAYAELARGHASGWPCRPHLLGGSRSQGRGGARAPETREHGTRTGERRLRRKSASASAANGVRLNTRCGQRPRPSTRVRTGHWRNSTTKVWRCSNPSTGSVA